MDLTALMTTLGLAEYIPYVLAAVGVASILAKVLPHPAVGSKFVPARTLLDAIAQNGGNATNSLPGISPKVAEAVAAVDTAAVAVHAVGDRP